MVQQTCPRIATVSRWLQLAAEAVLSDFVVVMTYMIMAYIVMSHVVMAYVVIAYAGMV